MPDLSSAKIVLRCRDFAMSRAFYSSVLGLTVVDEWDEAGGKGAIFALSSDHSGGYVEIYEMAPGGARYDPSFSEAVHTDKIDLQLRADSVDAWIEALEGQWPFDGPDELPWGQRWIRLKDPDGMQIAIYEGQV
ncbi:MAG TPA: VOC family protein [Actinomycetota bacterium]|nr:VOC family protein [Actinomycetota bacterium]